MLINKEDFTLMKEANTTKTYLDEKLQKYNKQEIGKFTSNLNKRTNELNDLFVEAYFLINNPKSNKESFEYLQDIFDNVKNNFGKERYKFFLYTLILKDSQETLPYKIDRDLTDGMFSINQAFNMNENKEDFPVVEFLKEKILEFEPEFMFNEVIPHYYNFIIDNKRYSISFKRNNSSSLNNRYGRDYDFFDELMYCYQLYNKNFVINFLKSNPLTTASMDKHFEEDFLNTLDNLNKIVEENRNYSCKLFTDIKVEIDELDNVPSTRESIYDLNEFEDANNKGITYSGVCNSYLIVIVDGQLKFARKKLEGFGKCNSFGYNSFSDDGELFSSINGAYKSDKVCFDGKDFSQKSLWAALKLLQSKDGIWEI
jgi:hypothetical protein